MNTVSLPPHRYSCIKLSQGSGCYMRVQLHSPTVPQFVTIVLGILGESTSEREPHPVAADCTMNRTKLATLPFRLCSCGFGLTVRKFRKNS